MATEIEPIKFIGQIVGEFPRDVTDSLWDQGIDMDDWDYAILAAPDVLERSEDGDYRYPSSFVFGGLTAHYKFVWKVATIRDEQFALGIAYH